MNGCHGTKEFLGWQTPDSTIKGVVGLSIWLRSSFQSVDGWRTDDSNNPITLRCVCTTLFWPTFSRLPV
jgi:hypothetical protein